MATPIPGWVDDMRPAVEGRTVALAGAVAAKITGAPIDARMGKDDIFELRPASRLDGPVVGHARTFVGFDASRVFTCFAACAPKLATATDENLSPPACDRAVNDARLEGSRPPPSPGVGLRGATWAVHHPRPAAFGVLGLILLVGFGAVVFRRRPRSSI